MTDKDIKNHEGDVEGAALALGQLQNILNEPDNRIIRLFGEIGLEASFTVWSSLLEFQKQDPKEPIFLLINSRGGDVIEALSIWDAIKSCTAPVYTIGTGKIMSAGAFLMYAGEPGCRYLTPNSVIMSHQMSYFTMGKISYMAEELEQGKRLQERFLDLMVDSCSLKGNKTQKRKLLEKHWLGASDKYFFADEAIINLGLADKVGGLGICGIND